MSDSDQPFDEMLAALRAKEEQTLASIDAMASMVARFRGALLYGNLPAELADDLVRGYFAALLDTTHTDSRDA